MTISADGSCLVPKAPGGAWTPKPQRFYNWDTDEDGYPDPQKFDALDVPCDDWHLQLAIDGAVSVDGPEKAARMVDKAKRDKQLQAEAKIGWHIKPPSKLPKAKKTAKQPAKDAGKD
jgi:hypothetical protein